MVAGSTPGIVPAPDSTPGIRSWCQLGWDPLLVPAGDAPVAVLVLPGTGCTGLKTVVLSKSGKRPFLVQYFSSAFTRKTEVALVKYHPEPNRSGSQEWYDEVAKFKALKVKARS